jgi:hypothetical protein
MGLVVSRGVGCNGFCYCVCSRLLMFVNGGCGCPWRMWWRMGGWFY